MWEELASRYTEVEDKLEAQARKLMVACSENTQDLKNLHSKEEIANIQTRNTEVTEEFRGDFSKAMEEVSDSVEEWKTAQLAGLVKVGNEVENELSKRQAVLERLADTVEHLSEVMKQGVIGESSGLAEISVAIKEANIGINSANEEKENLARVGGAAKTNMKELVTALAKVVNQQSQELLGLNTKVNADLDLLVKSASNNMSSTVKRLGTLDR